MLQSERRLFFRPDQRRFLPLPLAVRSTGHYLLNGDQPAEDRYGRDFFQLFWVVQGAGMVALRGKRHRATVGSVFLYRPGEMHSLEVVEPPWEYRWLTLHGEASRAAMGLLPDLGPLWSTGPCPIDLFERLIEAVSNPTKIGERLASALTYRICLAAWFGPMEPSPGDPLAARAVEWLRSRFTDPATTIDVVADHCRIHRSTLYRLFRRHLGISPSAYLSDLRLQHALKLLRESPHSIAEIARASGYSDPNFLARCVCRATGVSPRVFRSGPPG